MQLGEIEDSLMEKWKAITGHSLLNFRFNKPVYRVAIYGPGRAGRIWVGEPLSDIIVTSVALAADILGHLSTPRPLSEAQRLRFSTLSQLIFHELVSIICRHQPVLSSRNT